VRNYQTERIGNAFAGSRPGAIDATLYAGAPSRR
jgi:hypothetical protein